MLRGAARLLARLAALAVARPPMRPSLVDQWPFSLSRRQRFFSATAHFFSACAAVAVVLVHALVPAGRPAMSRHAAVMAGRPAGRQPVGLPVVVAHPAHHEVAVIKGGEKKERTLWGMWS